MNTLISIIVPIYKVEVFLPRCVDSLINQTYCNLEIILVDDGSPDQSGEICDSYADKDDRIIVVHKENGGLSDARNVALDIARGDYLLFVDSDDWLELDTCEKVHKLALDNQADVVSFGIRKLDEKEVYAVQKVESSRLISKSEAMGALLWNQEKRGLLNYVCNKLFAKCLFDDIRFPVGKLFEDQGVTYKLIHKASRIYATDEVFYNYYQHGNSITAGWYQPKAIKDRFVLWSERLVFLKDKYPQYVDLQVVQLLVDAYIGDIKLKNISDYKELRESLKTFANQFKQKEKELTKYSKKIMLHYYCYPLFYLYALFIKSN